MSDFTDFLAAVAIEDAIEESGSTSSGGHSKRSSSKSDAKHEPMTAGCWLMLVCDLLSIIAAVLTSWWYVIPITVLLTFVVGLFIDVNRDLKKRHN